MHSLLRSPVRRSFVLTVSGNKCESTRQSDRQTAAPSWQTFESFTCCSSQTVHINVSLQRWQFSSFSRTFSSQLSLQLNNQLFVSRWRTLRLIWGLAPVWGLTLQLFYCRKKHLSRIGSFHGFHLLCSPADSVNQLKAAWTFLSTHKDEIWYNNKKLLPGGVFPSSVRFQFEDFEHLYFSFYHSHISCNISSFSRWQLGKYSFYQAQRTNSQKLNSL